MKKKIVFFGSSDFATESLKEIICKKHNLIAVVTNPNKAAGRGMKIHKTKIKLLAEKGFEGPLTPYPDPSQFNGITRDSLVRQAADSVQLNSLQEESLEEPEAELVASGSEDAESVS